MSASKSPQSNKQIRDVFAPRAIEDPAVYTTQELKVLVRYALQYGRGVMKGRNTTADHEQAEMFRRKFEVIWIFKGLPERLRKRPTGQTTKDAVIGKLEKIGIPTSETTLMRVYRALGGAKQLSSIKPFAEGDDRSSPLEAYQRRKPSKAMKRSKLSD